MSWPLISVHAALTPDGRVLTYGTDGAGKQTGYFIYDIWDPSAGLGAGHLTLNNMTLTDIFCSSQVILPQSGQILISGGDNWTGTGTTNTGNNNSNIFDTFGNTLARSANMNRARWYSSSTVLVNGDVYIQGGSGGGDFPEVRQGDGTFRLLTTAGTSGFDATFPRNFLAPDGRIFGYDTTGRMYYVNAGGTGTVSPAGQLQSANAGWTSSAAMFRPGKILQMGGNSNSAAIIDINGPTPTVTQAQSMSTLRRWVSATVLPDGKVLATGGSEVENQLTGVNNRAEIWDPATGTWHLGTAGVPARLYHSSALLLPDATVLIAGGGAPGPQVNTNAEIYSPPYLFDDSGELAPRPQIVSAPSEAEVGDTIALEVSGAVSRITLVKTGSVTHSVNMDQRFVELPFTASGNSVWAQLPARATDTPPGYYHVFAVDPDGVPSVSKMLRINIDSTPSTAVDYTATIGGAGGGAFQLSCAIDETLVGVYGRYGTYVNQIGPQCVKVDQFGRWIGDPVQRPVTGTLTTGTAFDKLCPRDAAVSGFRGSSAQYVNQIELQCRALTPSGGLTGAGSYLGITGTAGGTAQALQTCGTGNPVYALYGRSGSWIDAFGVLCRTGAITPISTNSTPVVVNPGAQSWIAGIAVDLAISASDGDGDALIFSATGLPAGLQIDAASGHITGAPRPRPPAQRSSPQATAEEFGLTAFDWTVAGTAPLSVTPLPPQTSQLAGSPVSYSATATGGVNVVYKWQFGDGTPETARTPSPSVVHTFTGPGIYFVTLTVTDDLGVPNIQRFVQTIHLAPTPALARASANIAYETRTGSNSRVWVVNQDNDSVTVVDAVTNARLNEIAVGAAPRSVAIAPDGRIWVVNNKVPEHQHHQPVEPRRRANGDVAARVAAVRHRVLAGGEPRVRRARGQRRAAEARRHERRAARVARGGRESAPRRDRRRGRHRVRVAIRHAAPARRGDRRRRAASRGGRRGGRRRRGRDGRAKDDHPAAQRQARRREPRRRRAELPRRGRDLCRTASRRWCRPSRTTSGAARCAAAPTSTSRTRCARSARGSISRRMPRTTRAASITTTRASRARPLRPARHLSVRRSRDEPRGRGARRARQPRAVPDRRRPGAAGRGRFAGRHEAVRQQLHGPHCRRL